MNRLRATISLMRLDKPVGIWLVFYPAAWALVLASTHAPSPELLGLLLLGAVLMRSAGCIINDMMDRSFDAQVMRTKARPLASGALSMRYAALCVGMLLAAAFGLLFVLPHNPMMLAFMVVPLVIAYPFMKRITWWPQVFLGLVFNTAVLFGWLQASEELPLEAYILYGACAFWTLGYDTIYAIQDIEDDARIGVKSTARRMGMHAPTLVAVSYTISVALWAGLIVRWQVGDAALMAVMLMAGHFLWQVRVLKSMGAEWAGKLFASNATLGLMVFVLLLCDHFSFSNMALPQ